MRLAVAVGLALASSIALAESENDDVGQAQVEPQQPLFLSDNALEQPIHSSKYSKSPYTNTTWEQVPRQVSVYDSPYNVALFSGENGEDIDRLWSQTKSIFWYASVLPVLLPCCRKIFLTGIPVMTACWRSGGTTSGKGRSGIGMYGISTILVILILAGCIIKSRESLGTGSGMHLSIPS